MKETLEEAAEKYSNKVWDNIITYQDAISEKINTKIDFINGAKWQAERMYSEEEVKIIASNLFYNMAKKQLSKEVVLSIEKIDKI